MPFGFTHEIMSPLRWIIEISVFRIFRKFEGLFKSFTFSSGIKGNGEKFFANFIKFLTRGTPSQNENFFDTNDKLFAGAIDTDQKFVVVKGTGQI
jgi:hypothetical protein